MDLISTLFYKLTSCITYWHPRCDRGGRKQGAKYGLPSASAFCHVMLSSPSWLITHILWDVWLLITEAARPSDCHACCKMYGCLLIGPTWPNQPNYTWGIIITAEQLHLFSMRFASGNNQKTKMCCLCTISKNCIQLKKIQFDLINNNHLKSIIFLVLCLTIDGSPRSKPTFKWIWHRN